MDPLSLGLGALESLSESNANHNRSGNVTISKGLQVPEWAWVAGLTVAALVALAAIMKG